MFAPRANRTQAKTTERPTGNPARQRSALVAGPWGRGAVEQERTSGRASELGKIPAGPTAQRPLAGQFRGPAGDQRDAALAQPTERTRDRAATPGPLWSFSQIPLFPPAGSPAGSPARTPGDARGSSAQPSISQPTAFRVRQVADRGEPRADRVHQPVTTNAGPNLASAAARPTAPVSPMAGTQTAKAPPVSADAHDRAGSPSGAGSGSAGGSRSASGSQNSSFAGAPLPAFPHHRAIARAFGLADFTAPAVLDPSVSRLGAEAATERGHVRFARWPSLEVAAHEATHVVQGRGAGRRTDAAGAERHASAVAGRLVRGLGAADLLGPEALVSAATPGPLRFVPTGSAPATHTVVPGETLTSIARAVYGEVRYADAIRRANPHGVGPAGLDALAPGTLLSLPDHPDPADPWVNPFVSPLLRNGGLWTEAQAEAALRAYAAESASHRDAMVAHYLPFDNFTLLLRALPADFDPGRRQL